MKQKTLVPSGCSLPTTRSTSPAIKGLDARVVAGSALNNVIFRQFDRGQDVPLPNGYVDIDSFVAGFEKDPEQRQAIEDARRIIASNFYGKPPRSLAALRLEKGWSQARLATEMVTSQPHIARIETGREDVRLSTLKKLADKLDVPLADVIHAIETSARSM